MYTTFTAQQAVRIIEASPVNLIDADNQNGDVLAAVIEYVGHCSPAWAVCCGMLIGIAIGKREERARRSC